MPLSANLPTFKNDMKTLVRKYAKSAFEQTFTQSLKEGHTIQDAIDLTSKNFSDEFCKIAPDLCDLIDKHIKSALLTPALSNGAGAVSGKITIS